PACVASGLASVFHRSRRASADAGAGLAVPVRRPVRSHTMPVESMLPETSDLLSGAEASACTNAAWAAKLCPCRLGLGSQSATPCSGQPPPQARVLPSGENATALLFEPHARSKSFVPSAGSQTAMVLSAQPVDASMLPSGENVSE